MNLAEFSIKNPLISAIAVIIAMIGGLIAYQNMSRFEDPEFTIRIAQVFTAYPGASPEEVMNEVTEPLETAIQQMSEVDVVTSTSSAGLSEIKVEIRYAASRSKSDLQLVWTKLRNRINDAQTDLPPGAGPSIVNDDFGDVYGLYYLLTGEGYTPAELLHYAEDLRKDLLLVEGVAKVSIAGEQEEAIYVEISRERAAALGVSINAIYDTLDQQNAVVAAGDLVFGDERLIIHPTGELTTVASIENLIIADGAGVTRLRSIADVSRGYREPASFLIRYEGEPALAIGVSNVLGANVVKLGEAIDLKLAEVGGERPIGMQLHEFYHQGKVVDAAIQDFVLNVIMALVIVFVTLLIFMGWRSGLIMGATVLLTMAATLLIMYVSGIPMHRVSLGALVISLGMLVDNGVVITDGILVGVQKGRKRLDVIRQVARKNVKPLIGGTLVGIIAFAPIGFAPGDTAEYTNHLFWVVMIALALSWFFAFTFTPLLCNMMFTPQAVGQADGGASREEGRFYKLYRGFIRRAIDNRAAVLIGAVAVFATSLYGFRYVKDGFFPSSTTPQVIVDFWMPEGTDIARTSEELERLEAYAMGLEGVENVQALVGRGTLRYMLVYDTESGNAAYGQLILRTRDYRDSERLIQQIQSYADNNFPEAQAKAWRLVLGPGGGSKIEATFKGPEPAVLRGLANEAKAIIAADGGAMMIKDDWRRPVPFVQPVYSESKGERVGVSRKDFADALQTNFSGRQIGVFREGDDLIPIISRAPEAERQDPLGIASIQVVSPSTGRVVPLLQVGDDFNMVWRDSRLLREDRIPTIKAQADPRPGVLAGDLFNRVRPQIEAIELPQGYTMEWDGEFGDSSEAQGNLASTIPLGFLVMVLVVVILFNKIRQPIIIWFAVPLGIIGVTIGLLVTRTPFEFMGLLGLLSLSGLLIQNSLVLVDHTDNLIADGMPRYDALIESAASRLRPVTMGAFTTVLGVIPLYFDAFFKSMTVVLVFGLSFATLITLVITPVVYAILFKIRRDETASA